MLWVYIIKGGYLMFFIGICSIVALAIFVERFFYLKKTEKDNTTFLGNLFQRVQNHQIIEAIHLCDNSSGILSADILKVALIKSNRSRPELKESVEEAANREIPKLETNISALGTIASISPLLGLLGTVLGMIDSLSSMESSLKEGMQNTSGLLEGIWTALITTAAGLIVAIPSLTGYNYLVTKVNNLIVVTKNKANEVVEMINFEQEV